MTQHPTPQPETPVGADRAGAMPAPADLAAAGGALRRVLRDENGQAMVEYVIMIGFLIVTAILVDQLFTEIIKDQAQLYLWSIMDP